MKQLLKCFILIGIILMFTDALLQGSPSSVMFLNGCIAGIAICTILSED